MVGAYGGLPWNPDWYQNLVKHPGVRVEVDGTSMEISAAVVAGCDREVLWPRMVDGIATLANSEALAAPRAIPLVRLSP